MSNNEKNYAVEYPQITKYYRRKMAAILKQIRHVLDKDVDDYIEYLLSDEANTTDIKPGIVLIDDCNFMQDFIRYINRQLVTNRRADNYTDKDC